MKICFLAGASSIHTVRWVNEFAKLGHEVALLTIQSPDINLIDERVKIYDLKVKNKLGYYFNIFQARKIINKLQPDIINAHYASGYGTLGRLIKYEPLILSVWGSDVYLYPYKNKLNEYILRKNLKAATLIASTSYDMKRQTEKFVNPKNPIVITPFGIDMNKFSPQNLRDEKYITIGTVKTLEHIYGIDILINAFYMLIQRLKSENKLKLAEMLRLQIVGKGSERKNLEQLVRQLKIENCVEFTGPVPNEEVPNYLNKFDIFCAFSRSESFGVAVLEASACEVPVVVSDVGGLPEVVKDGETGYVINNYKVEEIVDKLFKLVMDENLRFTMGKCGREFVLRNYDWDNNVIQMLKVYENIIRKNK